MGCGFQRLNAGRTLRAGFSLGLCSLTLLLGACRVETESEEQPIPAITATPTPAPTKAVVPTFTPTAVIRVVERAPLGTPSPTPTLQSYIVAAGDTLIEIGMSLGVDPVELQAANNIEDPRTLQVGQSLVVPPVSGPQVAATPQPLLHRAQGLQAYVDGLGVPWMLGEIVNLSSEVVEQVRVHVLLLDSEQNEIARKEGHSYRYLTPPQEASPFMVALDVEEGSWNTWLLAVTSSRKAHIGRLYTDLEVFDLTFDQVSDHVVQIEGQLRNTGTATTKEAEVVLVLYSHAGGVVGVRIVSTDFQVLDPGSITNFGDAVFTIGIPVARVEAVGQGLRAG